MATQIKNLKSGDQVTLISLDKSKFEGISNWISREPSEPKVGDKFKVESISQPSINGGTQWIKLVGLKYKHPIIKFN